MTHIEFPRGTKRLHFTVSSLQFLPFQALNMRWVSQEPYMCILAGDLTSNLPQNYITSFAATHIPVGAVYSITNTAHKLPLLLWRIRDQKIYTPDLRHLIYFSSTIYCIGTQSDPTEYQPIKVIFMYFGISVVDR